VSSIVSRPSPPFSELPAGGGGIEIAVRACGGRFSVAGLVAERLRPQACPVPNACEQPFSDGMPDT
jgi:hypothetical protein